MQIFYDAQGKLIPQSEVGFTLNSNSRMKEIQSKMKALEWSQQCYIIHQLLRCSREANSLIGDGILTKFKLIAAFIVVQLSEEDPIKNECARVVTLLLHYPPIFKMLKGS